MTKIESALDRARTDDLRLIRATRYQLRYESCCPDDNTVLKQVSMPEKPQSIYGSALLAMNLQHLCLLWSQHCSNNMRVAHQFTL